ncbi:hypothetical protein NDU88_002364 [Pleurodeles waltl]|uniref:Uncharacterized protein n=1 Tax=Pleurodeles waltl TaxID=8319 RepID=A0AAV7SE37_PLEWA|nr:hypothetical protein NDU88_002364 [Pleurodeles waltl]
MSTEPCRQSKPRTGLMSLMHAVLLVPNTSTHQCCSKATEETPLTQSRHIPIPQMATSDVSPQESAAVRWAIPGHSTAAQNKLYAAVHPGPRSSPSMNIAPKPQSRADHLCRRRYGGPLPKSCSGACRDSTATRLSAPGPRMPGANGHMSPPPGEPGASTKSGQGGEPIRDGRGKVRLGLRTAELLADQAQPRYAIRYGARRFPESWCGPTM